MLKLKKGLFAVVSLCLCAVILTSCGQSAEQVVPEQEVLQSVQEANYKTTQVELGTYEKTGTGNASIVYPKRAELVWEKANTFYVETLVSNRQQVKKGDILMRFQVKVDQVEIETLKLQIRRAQENLTEGKNTRLAQIETAKNAAAAMVEQVPYEKELAELKVKKLQADYETFVYQAEYELCQLEEELAELKKTEEENVLVAPFDGVVESFEMLNEGDRILTGKVLVTIYDEDIFYLQASNIPYELRYNMDVAVESGNLGSTAKCSGEVIAAPNILPSSVSQDMVLIALEQSADKTDYENRVVITACWESLGNTLLVKKDALTLEEGRYFANILDENGIHKRYVMTGKTNGSEVCILDGLTEGQTLILD